VNDFIAVLISLPNKLPVLPKIFDKTGIY